MKNKNFILIAVGLVALVFIIVLIKRLGTKNATSSIPSGVQNTKTIQTVEIAPNERPYISLIPRQDGHQLTLKIDKIPSSITQIDYELIYTAHDEASGQDIEKGVSDTIKDMSTSTSRDLLLGTASCTNGCKYSYDEGISEGTLSLIFTTNDGQATYETPFALQTSTDIKKDGGLSLPTENFKVSATTTTKSDYFILIKNYQSDYSIFSNGTGNGKVSSITPNTVTKTNLNSITGDYLIP